MLIPYRIDKLDIDTDLVAVGLCTSFQNKFNTSSAAISGADFVVFL
jgi:hypothetical protein